MIVRYAHYSYEEHSEALFEVPENGLEAFEKYLYRSEQRVGLEVVMREAAWHREHFGQDDERWELLGEPREVAVGDIFDGVVEDLAQVYPLLKPDVTIHRDKWAMFGTYGREPMSERLRKHPMDARFHRNEETDATE